jgi:DNA-binding transcriptional LysR family regulator
VQWDDVRVVLALMRAPKLASAASSLGIDASTLSRRLARVEAEVGSPLFARTRDGLRPTAAAERLRAHAEAMEADATKLFHAMRTDDEGATGSVRLATTESLARMLVTEGLLELRSSHPDLVIEILSDNRPVDLVRGEADLAVRLAALHQPSLRARVIGKTGVGLFASEGYLRSRPKIRGPATLKGHDLLLPTGELRRLPETRWLEARPSTRIVFRSNSMPALIAAAVLGQGVVPLPLGWGDNEPGLVRVMVLDAIPERKMWLVTHDEASTRPAVVVVSRQIVTIFERVFAR